jgi:Uma2 family endonuclease
MSAFTETQPVATPAVSEWVPSPLYRLTLEQYEAMVATGVFTPSDRFHLINGFLVSKLTQNDLHCTADELCGKALDRVIPAGWHIRSAKPIRLPGQLSKPEPDRVAVRGEIRGYRHRAPGSADICLVVEVSDTSLSEDRKLAQIYAASGIPVYWIVNLLDRQVEVYSDASPTGYRARVDFRVGQEIPVVVDGALAGRIAVADILP